MTAEDATALRQQLTSAATTGTETPLHAASVLLTAAFELLSSQSDPFFAVDVMRSTASAIERAFMASRAVQ